MSKKPILKEKETFKLYSEHLVQELEKKMLDLEKSNKREKELEEGYKTVFENTGTATVVIEEDTVISMANTQFEKLSGYSKNEIENKMKWTDFVIPEDLEKMKKYHIARRKTKGKAATEYEFHFIDRKGNIKDIFLKIGMIPGIKKSVASLMDITERKKANEKIKQEKDKAQQYLNISLIMFIVIDKKGIVTLVNKKTCEILGYEENEIVGKNWIKNFIPKRFKKEVNSTFKKILASDMKPVEYHENAILTKSGEERLISWHNSFIKDKNGNITGHLSSGEDITERKKAEEKIKHLNLVLRAIRNVNQLIVKEKNRERLLKGVCNNLIKTRGYYNVWIALLDKSGKLETYAEAGLGKAILPMIETVKKGELTVCGQKALKQQEVVTIKDPASTCPECPLIKQHSNRRAMTIRLEYSGKVYGFMSVCIPAHLVDDQEEQSLFKEVAEDISFALHNIETEEKHAQLEEELEENFEKWQKALDGTIKAIAMMAEMKDPYTAGH